jgi:hypothetical protein
MSPLIVLILLKNYLIRLSIGALTNFKKKFINYSLAITLATTLFITLFNF